MAAHGPVGTDTLGGMLRIDINRDSPVAPYQQIARWLIAEIRAGRYGPEDRLPSTDDLMAAAGVARMTARKALRTVADEGLAQLSPGMGYYVPETLPPGSLPS